MSVKIEPDKVWWTASEIAEAGLVDLPETQQGLEKLAKQSNWREHPTLSRKRSGRGGGWEYNWQLFPMRARRALLKDVAPVMEKVAPSNEERQAQHAAFDALPESVKHKARERLAILQKVNALVTNTTTKFIAVELVAVQEKVSARTVWNWFALVEFIPEHDWLFYLVPRHRMAARKVSKAKCDRAFMEFMKSDYLRLDGPPTFTSCYERAVDWCKAKKLAFLTERTARRRLNEEVPRVTQVFAREGEAGLQKCFPAQIRDRTSMVAMEGVNADCHKFDVFVQWPDEEKPGRAQLVAFQDIYSGKILSWRIDYSPNKVAVMAAFGDLIEQYGIPLHCLFDNGREFANKWLTGGAKTRFRFKINDDDPLGVLTTLGIQVHWATPGHGQAKPIERAFRDLADRIAKDPRFSGAYVGNKPDAKPENYGSRAIPLEDFVSVVAEGIARHNARLGRRSETVLGGSFDEAFAKSYASVPVRKATDEQRRLWLMGAEPRKLHKNDGGVTLAGNRYWSAWMNEYAGQKVVVRFDPEDLHAGLYIYSLDGAFMGMAATIEKVGFFDLTGAKDHARKKAQIRRTERKLLDQHRSMKPKQLGVEMDSITPDEPAPVDAKVVQMMRGADRPNAAKVTRPQYVEAQRPEDAAEVLEFQKKFKTQQQEKSAASENDEDKYLRALELERRSEAGERLGESEVRWLNRFQQTSAYRSMRRMQESFGADAFLK